MRGNRDRTNGMWCHNLNDSTALVINVTSKQLTNSVHELRKQKGTIDFYRKQCGILCLMPGLRPSNLVSLPHVQV